MSENLRSPDVYQPKTIQDIISIKQKNRKAILWAGGTNIMSRPDYYPNPKQNDIIRLDEISELSKIIHTDRYIEVGSMVSLQHLITNGASILSKEVLKALADIGNSSIRSGITLGGCLASSSFRSSASCILATIGAIAELRFFNRKSLSRWINVSKLYDNSGHFIFEDKAFIEKVRIPSAESEFAQFFTTLDSPMQHENSSVSVGLQFTVSQGNINQSTLCISYPVSGFFMSNETDFKINSVSLPAKPELIKNLSLQIKTAVKKNCPNVTELQLERTERLLEQILFNINLKYLAG